MRKRAAMRQLSTKELGDYVIWRVEQLAKALQGDQEPQYLKGRGAEDYVLVKVRGSAPRPGTAS